MVEVGSQIPYPHGKGNLWSLESSCYTNVPLKMKGLLAKLVGVDLCSSNVVGLVMKDTQEMDPQD